MKSLFLFLLPGIFFLANCSSASQPNDPVPAHETFTIQSKGLNETRTINVWLPEEYSKHTDSLPVMYMPDGGLKEDFPHIANTFAKLVKAKTIPPFILVGIENTQRRRDLTGPTEVAKDKEIAPVVGGSESFRAFIREELFPEISKRYRTTGNKGILGESAAGLFVMETFLLEPGMFDYYIAFDPSLWWNDHYLVKVAKQQLGKLPAEQKILWFAGSGAEDIAVHTKAFADILKTENLPQLRWNYADEPEEKHNTIFRATKEKALAWALSHN